MSGYDKVLSIQTITKDDIEYIEEKIRIECLHLPQKVKVMFNEFFTGNLNQFEFRRGDQKMILIMANRVKKMIEDHGLQYFNTETKKQSKLNDVNEIRQDCQLHNPSQFFLTKLLSTANRNTNRKKEGYRYDRDIQLYASYIRMIAGPLAYETLQRNLEAALPSLPSTNRYIREYNCHIVEGILRCEELRIYLSERKLPMTISLSEDATRVIDKVQYDPNTNQLIGFVLPINCDNGLPIPFQFPARNADEILSHFSNENAVSSFLNVVVAQPLANAPRFCLLMYGSDSRYSASDVTNRWKHIISELKKVGIKVLTFASDSDPKYNSAMRELTKINKSRKYDWFACEINDDTFFIQDIVHIATKLRNFLLRLARKKHKVPFGRKYIDLQHLHDLIDKIGRKNHLLTLSTLYPDDRQNFKSVQRMCSIEVICSLKENVKNSEGTAQFFLSVFGTNSLLTEKSVL